MCSFSRFRLLTVIVASRASLQSRPPETRPSNFSSASANRASPSEPDTASSCESPSAVIAMRNRSRSLLLTAMRTRMSSRLGCVVPLQSRPPDTRPSISSSLSRRTSSPREPSLSRNRELPSAVIAMWTFSLPSLLTVMRASRASLQSRPPDTRPSNFSSASTRSASPSEPSLALFRESPSAVIAMCSRSRCLLLTVMLARRSV